MIIKLIEKTISNCFRVKHEYNYLNENSKQQKKYEEIMDRRRDYSKTDEIRKKR